MKINLKKASDALRRIIEEAGGELPENQLAIAVINQAITDIFIDHKLCKKGAVKKGSKIYKQYITDQARALRWINYSPDFGITCDFAYLNEEWVSHLINSSYDKYMKILNGKL